MGMVSIALLISGLVTTPPSSEQREDNIDRIMTPFLADNFAEEYDARGAVAFNSFLTHSEGAFPFKAYLLAEDGHEVLGRPVPPDAQDLFRLSLHNKETVVLHRNRIRWVGQWITAQSGRQYVLVLKFDRVPPDSFLSGISLFQVFRILLALVIIGLVCFWTTRHITSPILELRKAANLLAQGNFATRVDPAALLRSDEIGDLSRDFDHMAAQIEILLASQHHLISDISHELRSPLARLGVALGIARRSANPESNASLNRIERETERLNELIGGLLSLARMESDSSQIAKESVDLQQLVQEIVDDANFEAGARSRSVTITSSFACSIDGNHDLLRSAIENVVRNAINYTPEHTAVEVSLSPGQAGRTATIQVCDHGPGVPDSALKTIFEPFYRVEESRERVPGGTGLGLSITARAARRHAGSVEALNSPSGGLIIQISLPLSR